MKKLVVLALVLGLVLAGKVGAQDKKAGEKSLLAYWSFDEGKGDIAKDYSGRGNNGTVIGAEWVNGVKGKALKFNGTNNQVEVEMNEKLQFTTAVTIEVWVYPTPPHQQSYGGIINNINGFPNSRILVTDWVLVAIQPVGLKQSPTHGEYFSVKDSTLKNDVWNYLVYVYDGKEESLYVDGKKVGSAPYSEEWPVGDNAITIGWGYIGPEAYHFNGIIDEMKIYNYAHSEKEISDRYKEIKK